MIKNKKTTSRFMSVISTVIAVVMLSATVFASGVLSDLTTDDYTIEILNNGEKIELTNKPFIENKIIFVWKYKEKRNSQWAPRFFTTD